MDDLATVHPGVSTHLFGQGPLGVLSNHTEAFVREASDHAAYDPCPSAAAVRPMGA